MLYSSSLGRPLLISYRQSRAVFLHIHHVIHHIIHNIVTDGDGTTASSSYLSTFDYILQMFLSRDWRSDWTYVLCSRMQERGEGEVPGWEAGDYQGDSGPILSYS